MEKSLKTIAILSIIALILSFISGALLSFFSAFSLLIVPAIIRSAFIVLISLGFIIISKQINNRLLKISSYSLIVLSIMSAILNSLSLIAQDSQILNISISILIGITAIFTLMLGIGVIGLRQKLPVLMIITGGLFILNSIYLGISSIALNSAGISFISFLGYMAYFLSIIIFFIMSADTSQNTGKTLSKQDSDGKLIAKGYAKSFLIALIVAVIGALFEAVILAPLFGFVTFTLGPDILFVIVNLIYFFMAENRNTKIGIGIGFLNVIFVAIISFFVFLFTVALIPSLGRGLF